MAKIAAAVAGMFVQAVVTIALTPIIGPIGAAIVGSLAGAAVTAIVSNLLDPVKAGTKSIRQPIAYHKLVRGQFQAGGILTFADNPNGDKNHLDLVVTLSAQPAFSVDTLMLSGIEVPLDSSGHANKPYELPDGTQPTSYHNYVTCHFGNGTVAGDADLQSWLLGESINWTPDCHQDGRAKMALDLQWNTDLFSAGIPSIGAIMRGRMVYDPRQTGVTITTSSSGDPGVFNTAAAHGLSPGNMVWIKGHSGAIDASGAPIAQEYEVATTPSGSSFTLYEFSQPLALTSGGSGGTVTKMIWTDNSHAQIVDFLCDKIYGSGAIYADEIDETQFIAGLNICDEMVLRVVQSTTFTADPSTDLITYDETQAAGDIQSLVQVMVSNTGGSLPGGLDATTVYYFARHEQGPFGYLCLSINDAKESTPEHVDITSPGSGTQTLTLISTFTVIGDGGDDRLFLVSPDIRLTTGTLVHLSSTGTLPSPFSAGTDYYVLFSTRWHTKLCASVDDARAGIVIMPTDTGSGTHIITPVSEPRYCCNGVADTQDTPQSLIESMLTSMAGQMVPSGASLTVFPAAYYTPAVTLDEDDLRGQIEVQTLVSGQQSFNSIRGVYTDPIGYWQPTDFPPRQDLGYIADDNGRVSWKDVQLPFTISSSTAQRIAKITLERVRRELIVKLQCMFTAFQIGAVDSFYVNNTMWGWSGQIFECKSWVFTVFDDPNGVPALGIDLVGQQNDANVYAWTAAEEKSTHRQSSTTLPDATTVEPPTDLIVDSGNDQLYVRPDGTVMVRVHLTWTSPIDQYVLDGGYIEIQYKPSADTNWLSSGPPLPGDSIEAFVSDVQANEDYDFAVRARNYAGAVSDTTHPWQAEILNYLVQGKSTPPGDIATLTVTQNGVVVVLSGSPISDPDVTAFEYRYGSIMDWDSSELIEAPHTRPGTAPKTAVCTTGNVPPGTWWFSVKARDTSGNYSADAAFTQATITNTQQIIIAQEDQAPGWFNIGAGTGAGFLRHYTGKLVPDSTLAANAETNAELFEQYVPHPVSSAIYEAPLIDFGSNQTVTVFFDPLAYAAGRGIMGSPNVIAQIDYWLDGGSDPGTWTTWNTGVITARYIRSRVNHTPSTIPGYIVDFNPSCAEEPTSEQHGTETVSAGGSLITFATPFHQTPDILVTGQGANVGWATGVSTTGFTMHIGPDTAHDNGGTGSWSAKGI